MTLPIIPNYQVYQVLNNSGGTAIIYSGKDCRTNKLVAIKKPRVNNADALQLLRKEAQSQLNLSSKHHPNITRLLDYVEASGSAYLIMEYINGMSLDEYQRTKTGPMPDEVAVPFFLQMLDAVGFIHQCGYLHKDIKPGNFMVRNDMLIKILDMGISAKLKDKDNNPRICGTPSFMPPEQFEKRTLGTYTDVFALGVTFYHMLTANMPFKGRDRDAIWANIRAGVIPDMRSYYPFTNPVYQPVVEKAMSSNPSKRYQTCEEFAAAVVDAYNHRNNNLNRQFR